MRNALYTTVLALAALSSAKTSTVTDHTTTTTTTTCTTSSSTTKTPSSTSSSSSAASTSTPGYLTDFTTLPGNDTFSFGAHYAVLNLDMINGLVESINTTPEGTAWIASTAKWINATHAQNPAPLSIFTRIYFSNAYRPEIGPDTPFAAAAAALGNATSSSPQSQLYSAFVEAPTDVDLRKSRYYAGDGNSLEEILRSQLIDTVIIVSCARR